MGDDGVGDRVPSTNQNFILSSSVVTRPDLRDGHCLYSPVNLPA